MGESVTVSGCENFALCLDRPIANPVVAVKEGNGDWVVLFNPDTADAVGINAVGVLMWGLMDGRHTLEDILRAVKGAFADVPGSVAEDVTLFVEDLAARGFVGYEVVCQR
ncbi:MAG: PqqD family peptide modification chaperone [Anaerolineae bacterium]|nr:PqqD family peptide modification chaperone [Anaerolineae bacterium]